MVQVIKQVWERGTTFPVSLSLCMEHQTTNDNNSLSSSSSDEEALGQQRVVRFHQLRSATLPDNEPQGDEQQLEPTPSTSGLNTMAPNPKSGVAIELGLSDLHNRLAPQNYKNELSRLQSFAGYPNASIDVRQMAAAGFFYTKSEDIVRCAFCGVEVGRWEAGDDPFEEHKKWSKNCRFMNGVYEGNIAVDPTNPPPLPQVEVNIGVDECGLYGVKCRDTSTIVPSLEKLGIQKRYDPVHPSYATLEARLESFSTWPVSMKIRPQELAEAGFFYTGLGDKTACFQCGGGLKDWEEDDEPWREHALFFSKCSFVLQTKGREFVAEVLGKKPPTLTPLEIQALKIPKELSSVIKRRTPPETASCSSEESLPNKSVQNDEISSRSDSENLTRSMGQLPLKRIEDARACKICFSEEIGVVFLPCGHLVACPKCAASLTTCAVCRQPFNATVRAFLS